MGKKQCSHRRIVWRHCQYGWLAFVHGKIELADIIDLVQQEDPTE